MSVYNRRNENIHLAIMSTLNSSGRLKKKKILACMLQLLTFPTTILTTSIRNKNLIENKQFLFELTTD